jgi:hypothetical protein
VTIPKLVRAAMKKHEQSTFLSRLLAKLNPKRGNATGYWPGIKPGHPHKRNTEPGTFTPMTDRAGRMTDDGTLQMWWTKEGWASDVRFHELHPDLEPGKCECCG